MRLLRALRVRPSLPSSCALLAALAACAGSGPRPDGTVELDDGYYVLRTPDDWNGRDPLPVVVHLHGYKGTPDKYLKNDGLLRDFSEGSVAVAFAAGDGDWNSSLRGSRRDDVAFLAAVADDLRDRLPALGVYLSGHSTGASMVYAQACHDAGGAYDGFLPISGAFWAPMPDACPGPRRPLMHLHGAADRIWEIDGGGWGAQTGARESLRVLRDAWSCGPATVDDQRPGDRDCTTWTTCGATLCVRPDGEHKLPAGWATWHADWMWTH